MVTMENPNLKWMITGVSPISGTSKRCSEHVGINEQRTAEVVQRSSHLPGNAQRFGRSVLVERKPASQTHLEVSINGSSPKRMVNKGKSQSGNGWRLRVPPLLSFGLPPGGRHGNLSTWVTSKWLRFMDVHYKKWYAMAAFSTFLE